MNVLEEDKVKTVLRLLDEIEFGSLSITVHNGQITQVDRTEKKRFENAKKNKK
ncbi:YezD family protein [Oceanobacillus sp. CFH 90083]|uniref:YezD family protein n=1 Tax=Oceanobacillus sp. CFH 90083 TaxID=2592336 RepID=UPI00128B96EE|nr:YezD family protein [Oceanobacillus sp. CFH 90083]